MSRSPCIDVSVAGPIRSVAFALALSAGCQSPSPAIVSVTPASVVEASGATIAIGTRECAPGFDLDRGQSVADPTAMLRIAGGSYDVVAMRTGDEAFSAGIPNTIPPGSYDIALVLGDGRRAPFDGHLTVTPTNPTVTSVTSSRSTIALGDTGVPVRIAVTNPSQCTVRGITVAPVFLRDGVDHSAEFVTHGPASIDLAASGETDVDFTVDLSVAVTVGAELVDARALGGTFTGAGGCTGTPMVASAGHDAQWVIVAETRALTVANVSVTPPEPHPGTQFNVSFTVTNTGTVAANLDTFDLASSPITLTDVPHDPLSPTRLAPGESAVYVLQAIVPVGTADGQVITLTVSVSATDDDGASFTSSPNGASATFTVRAH